MFVADPEAMRPIRLVMLVNTFDVGGAERVYRTLAGHLATRGYDVFAACLRRRSGLLMERLRPDVRVVDLNAAGKGDVRSWLRLYQLLRTEEIDVLYTFNFHAHVMGRIVGRIARVPVILSSQQTLGWEGPLKEWANRWTARWCTRVVASSRLVESYLAEQVRIPRSKLVTIYNAIELAPYTMLPLKSPWRQGSGPGPLIGLVGRLIREKDHDALLEAFVILKRRFPAARLLLAGDGPERDRLIRKTYSLGLNGAVDFLGHVQDVSTIYQRLDVYVQASRFEGLSCSVLEAMASGLPVVATRVGGTEEAVLDGESGLLVPQGDRAALADAICWLLEHPAETALLAKAGRHRTAAIFDAAGMVDATDRLIRELLAMRHVETRRSN